MRRFLTAVGLTLASTLSAVAQTTDTCAGIGINPTPQLNGVCPTTTAPGGSSGSSIGSGTTSAATSPLIVPNNPLGSSIDSGTTSSIPQAPQGMPPLIVPNDPLGTGNRDALSPGSGLNGNPSLSID